MGKPGEIQRDRFEKLPASRLEKILVIKLAGIGDLLTAFPALEGLRNSYPKAEISALVTPQTKVLLEGSGLVDRIVVLDKYLFDEPKNAVNPRSLALLIRLTRQLRAISFDVVLLFHHLLTWQGVVKYGMLISASRAPLRAGLDDGRGKFFNLSVKDCGFGYHHEVDYWLKTAALVGASNPNPRLRLRWGVDEEAYTGSVWEHLGFGGRDPVVAIHPGSGSYSPARRWMPNGFAAVVDALSSDGLKPLIVAGPGEEQIAQLVMEAAGARSVLLSGVPSPKYLAAFLSRCRLFVGNDSGVMHLAVAAGIPVVAIFGPSNHKAWGPYDPDGSRSRIVRLDLPCSPCLYKGQSLGLRYGCGEMLCLKGILPEMVVKAARDLLQTTRHGF